MQMNFFFSHKKYRSIFPISTVTPGLIDLIKNTKTDETVNLIILFTDRCKGKMFFEIKNQYNGLFWQCIGVGSIEACNCNKII